MAKGDGEYTIEDIMKGISQLAEVQSKQQQQIDYILGGDGKTEEEEFVQNDGNEELEEEKVNPNEHDYGDGRAKQDLVKHTFDTPEDRRSEMTDTPTMLVTPTSFVESIHEYYENKKKGKYERLTSIFIRKRDKRRVSVGRQGRREAIAMAQIQNEKEEATSNSPLEM